MIELITSLGQRLTERWMTAVLLPGLVYTAVAAWALTTGHAHAFDAIHVITRFDAAWRAVNGRGPVAIILAAVGLLAAAILVAYLAATLGEHVVHRAWTIRGPGWWAYCRQQSTKVVWERDNRHPAAVYLPQHATPIGDTFRLIGVRVDVQYGLSVPDAWPRIWLLAGPDTRTVITTAHQRYYTDATLTAWALLYLPLTITWWPAALIAALAATLGYLRAITAARTLANVMESTIDIHQHDLANALGVPLPAGRLTRDEGNTINDILTKRS